MRQNEVLELARDLGAPGELVRHLKIVAETTRQLAKAIPLGVDEETAAAGAAAHDLAKIRFPEELTGPGRRHSDEGREILLEMGLPPLLAEYAPGHMAWNADSPVEHVVVAAADVAWKGARNERVEQELERRLVANGAPEWKAYCVVDHAMSEAGNAGPQRLRYQATGQRP
jgi:HD superfamily phosphodiesterase